MTELSSVIVPSELGVARAHALSFLLPVFAQAAFAQAVFFDDFKYDSISGAGDALFGNVAWLGRATPLRAWWAARNDPPEQWLTTDASGDGTLVIRRPAGECPNDPTGTWTDVSVRSAVRFREGTYATRLRLDYEFIEYDHEIIQYFDPIAPAHCPTFCEYDFEYLPTGSWSCEGTPAATPTMYMVTHPGVPWERHCQSHHPILPATWYVLIVRAGTAGVSYEIWPGAGSPVSPIYPWLPTVPLQAPYLPDAYMQVAWGIWDARNPLTATQGAYTLSVDWVYHKVGDDSVTFHELTREIRDWQSVGARRVDTTADITPPSVTAFSVNGGAPAVLRGTATLEVSASDNIWPWVAEFAVSLNGGVSWDLIGLGQAIEGACQTWHHSWDTTTIQYAPRAWIRATISDGSGNAAHSLPIAVAIDNRAPGLTVSPASIAFGDVIDGTTADLTLIIRAGGGTQPYNWQIDQSLNWITATPSSGALQPGESKSVTIRADAGTPLGIGEASGTISVVAGSHRADVPVSITVVASGPADHTRYADMDAYIRTDTGQRWGTSHESLSVGWNAAGGHYRSFVQFPLGPGIDGDYIIGGSLDLYLYSYDGPQTTSVRLYRVLAPWSESSSFSTLANLPMQLIEGMDFVVGNQKGWYNLGMNSTFRNVVQGWADEPATNFGIALVFEWGYQGHSKHFISRHFSNPQLRPTLLIGHAPFEDNDGPLIAINSHVDGQHVTSASQTITGTAYDPSGVELVRVDVNGNSGTAQGTTNWSRTCSLTPGANTITVTAEDSSYNSNERIEQITVYYDVPEFTLVLSPSTMRVVPSTQASATVLLESLEGFSAPVALTASGLPAGVTASFAPNPATPTESSQLTLTVAEAASIGTFAVMITGTGGAVAHSDELTLEIETDCNRNGTPDEDELSAGIATDCDGNGMLDECESNRTIIDVDVSHVGCQNGSSAYPFVTVGAGTGRVLTNGTVRIVPGLYPETLGILRPMRLESTGGVVRIGP